MKCFYRKYYAHDARYIFLEAYLDITRLTDAMRRKSNGETSWRWRAKCNSTGIMFTAFTGTRIRPEGRRAITSQCGIRDSISRASPSLSLYLSFLIKSAGWGKLQAARRVSRHHAQRFVRFIGFARKHSHCFHFTRHKNGILLMSFRTKFFLMQFLTIVPMVKYVYIIFHSRNLGGKVKTVSCTNITYEGKQPRFKCSSHGTSIKYFKRVHSGE